MPSTSKKQHNFMAAVANNPAFAKKAGIPQSVGSDFMKADKGHKFSKGGDTMATKKMAAGGSTVIASGNPQKKGMSTSKMGTVRTNPGNINGVAEKGKTKGAVIKMKGNTVGNGSAMKRGGKVC